MATTSDANLKEGIKRDLSLRSKLLNCNCLQSITVNKNVNLSTLLLSRWEEVQISLGSTFSYRSASGRRGRDGWRWGGGGGCAAGVLEDLIFQVWVSRWGCGDKSLSCRGHRCRVRGGEFEVSHYSVQWTTCLVCLTEKVTLIFKATHSTNVV